MAFRKILKIRGKKKGQASLEYFILFAVIALLTLISLSSFLPKVRNAGEDFFNKAAGKIIAEPRG